MSIVGRHPIIDTEPMLNEAAKIGKIDQSSPVCGVFGEPKVLDT